MEQRRFQARLKAVYDIEADHFAVNQYQGDCLLQYSWAEFRNGSLGFRDEKCVKGRMIFSSGPVFINLIRLPFYNEEKRRDNGVLYGNGNIIDYDRVGDTYVINEGQAETVRMIFDLYLDGLGETKICKELCRRQRKDGHGNVSWSVSKISLSPTQ